MLKVRKKTVLICMDEFEFREASLRAGQAQPLRFTTGVCCRGWACPRPIEFIGNKFKGYRAALATIIYQDK
jgi:hypothetical protein